MVNGPAWIVRILPAYLPAQHRHQDVFLRKVELRKLVVQDVLREKDLIRNNLAPNSRDDRHLSLLLEGRILACVGLVSDNSQMQLFQLLRIDFTRRVDHQVLCGSRLRKRHHVSNVFRGNQNHQRAFDS